MAEDRTKPSELDQEKYDADDSVKIICLGDSAVGKSKYVGRLGKNNQIQNGSELLEESSRGTERHGFHGVVREESWLEPRHEQRSSHQHLCMCGAHES